MARDPNEAGVVIRDVTGFLEACTEVTALQVISPEFDLFVCDFAALLKYPTACFLPLSNPPQVLAHHHVFLSRTALSQRQWLRFAMVMGLSFLHSCNFSSNHRLAATLGAKSSFSKLPKRSVMTANISQLCGLIADPQEPMALRLSSNLMIGVARWAFIPSHAVFCCAC